SKRIVIGPGDDASSHAHLVTHACVEKHLRQGRIGCFPFHVVNIHDTFDSVNRAPAQLPPSRRSGRRWVLCGPLPQSPRLVPGLTPPGLRPPALMTQASEVWGALSATDLKSSPEPFRP